MTRRPSKSDSSGNKATAREAGAKIPDKPRDCGPNVDTWPILDEPVGKASGTKEGKQGRPGAPGS